MSQRRKESVGESPVGAVVRALRRHRGISLEELARLSKVSAPNLSRTERGLSGGVHPRHLDQIASVLGTTAVTLYWLAQAVADQPKLLDQPEEFVAFRDRLAAVERAYANADPEIRREIDRILGIE